MGLTIKTSKGKKYLYFQAGTKSIYIGPKNDISKVKTENVLKALDYSQGRVQHYMKSLDELLILLPESLREQYFSEQIRTLWDKAASRSKSIEKSPAGID